MNLTENESIFFFCESKTLVRIDDHFIRSLDKTQSAMLCCKDWTGKSILLSKITAYQLKEPGKTVGYLQLIFPSIEPKGGVFDAVKR